VLPLLCGPNSPSSHGSSIGSAGMPLCSDLRPLQCTLLRRLLLLLIAG
jgi:hypothetical protein